MKNRISQLTLLVVASLSLSGCSLYPSITSDSKLKPAAGDNDWLCFGSSFAEKGEEEQLEEARACALATLDDFSRLESRAANTDRTFSYALWGLGAWAGARAIDNKEGDDVLKNIAVSVAGLLGLREVVGTKEQRVIMKQGITAIQCVIDSADAVVLAKNELGDSSKVLEEAGAVFSRETFQTALSVDQSNSKAADAFNSIAGAQIQSLANLSSAINLAQNGIGLQLGSAVQQIRQAVRSELAKSAPDPSTVFDKQRSLVEGMVKKIAVGGEQAEQAMGTLEALNRGFESLSIDAATSDGIREIVAAANQVRNVREACSYKASAGGS